MEKLLQQFIARYEGRIDSYQHIIELIDNPVYDVQMIRNVCQSLTDTFTKKMVEDKEQLNKLISTPATQ